MSATWYYLEDGVTRGPAPHAELLELFREERLPAQTLVWREGLDDWRPAIEAGLLPPAPPPVPEQQSPPDLAMPQLAGAYQVKASELGVLAWRRYLARLVDFVFFAMLCSFFLTAFAPEVTAALAKSASLSGGSSLWVTFALLLAYVPFEALLLRGSGATPGKRLFALKVRCRNGGPLDFSTALERSARIFVLGQGCGVPILTQVVKLISFSRFQRTGSTLWDQRSGTEVVYGPMSERRKFTAAIVVGLYLALMYLTVSSQLA
ncbi:MAG: RDD family protein [Planctomycetes bacterium]|nr:RDD family protein [Planctomycetota bacterium]